MKTIASESTPAVAARPLLQSITPPRMRARLEEMKVQRPDIEALAWMLGPERLLEWAHSIGVATDEGLRACAPPLPPYSIRGNVSSGKESMFLWSGIHDVRTIVALYDRHAVPQDRVRTLDFGCGCARLARFLGQSTRFELAGSDANDRLVKWCVDNLPLVEVMANGPMPPLSYPNGAFDFIYSMSVFSHLPEHAARAWIRELTRVTAPGGLLVLTTNGTPMIGMIERHPAQQKTFRMTAAEATDLKRRFKHEQFVFTTYEDDLLDHANAGADYGITLIHEDYMRTRASESGLEVIAFEPAAVRGQDATVLRKSGASTSPG